MTEVIGEIFEKGVISQELKDAIESFQYKIALKEKYLANWLRKEIPNSYDAMTTSPVESLNCHIKHKTKANTLNNTSKSLLMITSGMSVGVLLLIRLYQLVYTNSYNLRSHPTGTDQRISDINKNAQRELQLTVISSKLSLREVFTRKCIYMLHDLFDARTKQYCVLLEDKTWIVWSFEYDPPEFDGDKFQLSDLFPTFASIYRVHVTKQGQQSFMKCDCRHYERCGIPCSHILAITDEIEDTMITVQHRKVFQVHYGCPDSDISTQLMKAVSMQTIYQGMGSPISDECLQRSMSPVPSRLNLSIHQDCSEYPLFYKGTTHREYAQALYILGEGNAVTVRELNDKFSQESTSPDLSYE